MLIESHEVGARARRELQDAAVWPDASCEELIKFLLDSSSPTAPDRSKRVVDRRCQAVEAAGPIRLPRLRGTACRGLRCHIVASKERLSLSNDEDATDVPGRHRHRSVRSSGGASFDRHVICDTAVFNAHRFPSGVLAGVISSANSYAPKKEKEWCEPRRMMSDCGRASPVHGNWPPVVIDTRARTMNEMTKSDESTAKRGTGTRFWWGFLVGVLIMIALPLVALSTGMVNLAATNEPGTIERKLGRLALDRSVAVRAPEAENPFAADPAAIQMGIVHFRDTCLLCHGAPGVEPNEFAKGLNPNPPELSTVLADWSDGELFWLTKHGIQAAERNRAESVLIELR